MKKKIALIITTILLAGAAFAEIDNTTRPAGATESLRGEIAEPVTIALGGV